MRETQLPLPCFVAKMPAEAHVSEPLDLLAIGPHPDDAEMTSGGWLAAARARGYRTGILHLSRGEMGTHGTPETREHEAREAARILGCSAIEFAGLADGHIRDDDESVRTVASWLRRLRPSVVIAPYFTCHHPDHEAGALLVRRAVHCAALKGYATDQPPHHTRRLVHARYSRAFEPTFYVDISAVLETKKAAILAYRSQFVTAVTPEGEALTRMSRAGFVDQFLSITAAYGLKCGCAHAEGYHVETGLLAADAVDLLRQGPPQHLIR